MTVVTNKLVQGFGTPGSIIDYSTKFLSRQIYNLFEIWFSYTDEEGKVYRLQWILHLDSPCLDHKCQQSFQNHPISLKTSPFQWYSRKCFVFFYFYFGPSFIKCFVLFWNKKCCILSHFLYLVLWEAFFKSVPYQEMFFRTALFSCRRQSKSIAKFPMSYT